MADKKRFKNTNTVDQENISVLIELVLDPQTTEHSRLQILNKLIESKTSQDFFDSLIEEALDLAKCPHCDHENNWLVPEVELNTRGIVTAHKDSRVKAHTKEEDCSRFAEACAKKKILA